jgi:hypothetical protein
MHAVTRERFGVFVDKCFTCPNQTLILVTDILPINVYAITVPRLLMILNIKL